MSIVSTENAFEDAVGDCHVCKEETQIFLVDCGHWACECCITSVFGDQPGQASTTCDNCPYPEWVA